MIFLAVLFFFMNLNYLVYVTASVFTIALIISVFIVFTRLLTRIKLNNLKTKFNTTSETIGFFHPYADACGGGEKVLFQAIFALQESTKFHNHKIFVYSSSN